MEMIDGFGGDATIDPTSHPEGSMITIGLCAIFVLGLGTVSLSAEKTEDPLEILAMAKEATGGKAWDMIRSTHTRMKISTSGLDGTAEGWEDVLRGRYTSRFELGPVTGTEGFDGEIAWSKDSSGQVLPEEGDDDRQGAANAGYKASLAYWYPERWPAEIAYARHEAENDRSFHIVRIGSGLIDRTVEQTAIETQTVFFSDYRAVGGVRYPFVMRQTNGETRYDMFLTVESIDLNIELSSDQFTLPAPPPPDYRFTGGKDETTLPFQLLNNHMYVEVRLNGRGPFLLLCDTGGANIVTPTLAKELGLEPMGALQGRGAGEGSEDVGLVRMDSLSVGDVTIAEQIFAVFPMEPYSDIEGVTMSGLIGYEVFKRFVVTVDYERSRLTLSNPETFKYEGDGTIVPFRFNGRIPQVDGAIDGFPGTFDIDTGARSSLTLMGPFVEKHGLDDHLKARVEGVTGWGVGGPVRTRVARAEVLRLGELEIPAPVTELSLQREGAFTDIYVAGNVGAGVLKRFNIVFDYANQVLIFEPNANVSLPDVFDRSGMWINRREAAFEVVDVISGGPAEAAGLSIGDRIVRVDGEDVSKLPLPAVRQRFRSDPPGTRIRLTILGDDGERKVSLVLENLV
jgi:hypothetical protein